MIQSDRLSTLFVMALGLAFANSLAGCAGAPAKTDNKTEGLVVQHAPSECPRTDLGESAEDCPWAGIARVLGGGTATSEKLMHEAPGLARQIEADKKAPALKALWGRSMNYDEFAKGEIVDPKILEAIAAEFGGEIQGRVIHAGMEHTYGYLFSNLRTPFGYKRARWVRNTLETGFGLPAGLLGPNPAEGTLFSNVSAFMGRIAFAGKSDARELAALRKGARSAAQAVRDYDFKKLAITRLEETVMVGGGKVILRTDFVPFVHPVPGEKNTHLLVYSVRDERPGSKGPMHGARIISGFPVEASFMERAFDAKGLGDNQPVITRYNGVVEGVTGEKLTGTRRRMEVSRGH